MKLDPLATYSDFELVRLEMRLWTDAVRDYMEARQPLPDSIEPGERTRVRKMLLDAADSANEAWARVNAERTRRGLVLP